MRLLLTRPEADARKSAERLGALGHDTLICPLFEIVSTGASLPPGPFSALLATSAHAFDGVSAPTEIESLPMHVVGERTAHAASKVGFSNVLTVAADAQQLASKMAASVSAPQEFLYLAGRERRPELEHLLAAQGHRIETCILYETRTAHVLPAPLAQALRDGRIDAALHFSPRSAAVFMQLAGEAGLSVPALALLHVAISAKTADALMPATHVRIAPTPDFDGLCAALRGA